MFGIEFRDKETKAYYHLFHSETGLDARIFPGSGATLQHLSYGDIPLIGIPEGWTYEQSYASSFLFPFANRINKGLYSFNEHDYQLACNDSIQGHAIHGLIYNKEFDLVSHAFYKESAILSFAYTYSGEEEGFPFSFDIKINYWFSGSAVQIRFNVVNTGKLDFPFSVGWHPYFMSKRAEDIALDFKSNARYLMANDGTFAGEEAFDHSAFSMDQAWDDCFKLNSEHINLQTSNYEMQLQSSGYESYLQVFTPSGKPCIAVEPVSAPLDSFNTKEGLLVLKAGMTKEFSWTLRINKK